MTDRGIILIAGASGFVGRALCTQLVREGRRVRAAVRPGADAIEGVERVEIRDFSSTTDWGEALDDIDCVVSLAARVHVMNDTASDPLETFREINLRGTLRLAHEAARRGVRRFVFISSVKVNGESTTTVPYGEDDEPRPVDPYGQSKWETELALRDLAFASGMEIVIVRPPLVYGPGVKANFARLTRWARSGVPLPLGAVRNRRSIVSLGNLIDFLVTVLDHPAASGQTFLVADREAISTPELYRRLARHYGRTAILVPVPVGLMHAAGRLFRRPEEIDRLVGSLEVSTAKAERLLGWRAPLDLDTGLMSVTGSDAAASPGSSGLRAASRPVGPYMFVKRLLDMVLAVVLGTMLTPVMLLIAVVVRLDSPGPALFVQRRAGRHHRPFDIYKFRTMRTDTPHLSTEEMRASGLDPVTRVGRLLRTTSLDELPQLWNVLRGEMSFVGPRPALKTQTRVLTLRERSGVDGLRPGITGLAQATGRDDLDDEEKVRRDTQYLHSMSLSTDLRILLLTLKAVFRARGVH